MVTRIRSWFLVIGAVLPTPLTAQSTAYAAALREIIARAPRLSLESMPLVINPPVPGWELGMVSWLAVDRTGLTYLFHRGDKADPIVAVDGQGKVVRSWGSGYQTPHSIRIDPDGNVWTTDAKSSLVIKYAPDGTKLLTIAVGGQPANCADAFCGTTDIAFGPAGRLFVADGYRNARIIEYTADGQRVREWGKPGTGPGEFRLPHSIVVDEDGIVYVADRENARVQRFDLDGKYLGEWPSYGKTFSLALGPGVVWLGTQDPALPNLAPGWVIEVDRRSGKMVGYADATGVHGIHVGASGEVRYSPGPDSKPQILRPR
jgi:streptogramin lyase